ncbi:CDP-diacylglycerol-serine O-phosphatidyltransferase [Monocercomonoides exilis]|uniref:CDP-diacylglycerol-serine O-phosphatidyltransferase n=1 Tax=Monocercomonoides exilis TaxID=2049356 RepID=UPI00355A26E8|nr:CDP-diacylglycerol-serine O-phosphatidyltransferase [Monocercomonoides exilis]|eukprot:MONOS_3854.1-p1 / transcript=MONOS_3854.1 / gene=MONOS_3854 / organism=Monocercomonoides_exilis_PA203 / gene_product=CDP-diacylglycerol-serine O-phosphatidyltransferase [2.7.8.8] / transcript_product=CDP-diacylglycerol-serine O-phosphatidyltransferase [2.7.8.8] / location=Mono_scaffold00095:20379-21911(-) / protein_length=418 / sequence_SO=supercontig / SO=protein_coding / is_pseudo=false
MESSADRRSKERSSSALIEREERSPSPSSSPDFEDYSKPKKENFLWKYRMVIPNGLTMGNALSGVFAGYCAVHHKPMWCSFLVVLGFIFDAFDGPAARHLKCSGDFGMFMDSLADVTTFGVAPTLALLSYFEETTAGIGIVLGVVHFTCTVVRLAKFMTEDGPPGVFRGMPCPFAGVFNAAVCAAGLDKKWIIVGSLIHSFYMIDWDTLYIKPFSVNGKLKLSFVWFLHFLALFLASNRTPFSHMLLALIPVCYGTIPVLVRLYRWMFKHAKSPGEFDYVMTVGVYDMFHRGHLELFSHMAVMGRNVYVAVHDEKSVYQNKKVRVTDSLEKRMNNVSKLRRVKKVFPVYTADPTPAIKEMLDAVPKGQSVAYMRGDDWIEFPGKPYLVEHNIPIIYHHYTEGVSSSLLRLARQRHTI